MWLALRSIRWLLVGLATNVVALVFFAWLAGEVLQGESLWFDQSIRESISHLASPQVTLAMQATTLLGSVLFLACSGALISIGFVLAKWRRSLIVFSITMAGAAILNLTLKASFRRIRPASFFDTPLPSSFSFPSGHALLSLCFYCAIAYLLAAHVENPAIRCSAWLIAVLLIVAVGFSRIYLGVHYPSDVLAAYAAATFWMVTVILIDRAGLHKRTTL